MSDRVSAISFFNQAAAIPKAPPYNGNPQLQYQLFSSAVMADPTMAQSIYELANAHRDMGLHPAAIACYRMMIDLPVTDGPGDLTLDMRARALVNMSHSLYTIGQHKEAEEIILRAIEINDQMAFAWTNLSLIESVTDRLDLSLVHAKMAFDLEPTNPIVETALAFAYLYAGDFATGLKHFEARFPYRLQHFLQYPFPKWNGEEGKTLYLVSEQGLGDALSFSRFLEEAARRSKFIHVVVQKELVRLLKASLQHVTNISIMGSPQPFSPADAWTTFMSLPVAMGYTNEQIINAPNIKIPQFMIGDAWKNKDAKFHIGVAWSGSPASDINHWRSFPVTMLLELCRVPGVQLYSIQPNDQAKELHAAGCGVLIRDLSPQITDVCDSIAIMDHLDLVITTESAPGHIASAAGIECWIPYSRSGRDWRASADGSSPIWSPKHRFFRQDEDGTWLPVFARMVGALMDRAWPLLPADLTAGLANGDK